MARTAIVIDHRKRVLSNRLDSLRPTWHLRLCSSDQVHLIDLICKKRLDLVTSPPPLLIMSLCSDLARAAQQVKSKPLLAMFSVLMVLFVFESVLAREMSAPHTAIRRLDCSVFCRKTGFSGYVGGCQCGFTLFANKRSQLRARLLQIPSSTKLSEIASVRSLKCLLPSCRLMYPENSFLTDDDSTEDIELRAGNKDRSTGLGAK